MMNIEIKANVQELIKHLKSNKKQHSADYNIAVKQYKKDIREALKELSAKAKGQEFLNCDYRIDLRKPELKENEYNKHIAMLELSTEDDITIDTEQFNCIVNNEWHWVQRADMINSTYLAKAGLLRR